jgi:hypothetical protein
MSLADLLPAVQSLPHPDQLRLVQVLTSGLGRAEGLPEVQPDAAYPVWSPYDAFEAAGILEQTLQGRSSHSGLTESM